MTNTTNPVMRPINRVPMHDSNGNLAFNAVEEFRRMTDPLSLSVNLRELGSEESDEDCEIIMDWAMQIRETGVSWQIAISAAQVFFFG